MAKSFARSKVSTRLNFLVWQMEGGRENQLQISPVSGESLWEESPAKFCFEWQLVKIRLSLLQNLKSYLTIQMHHRQANANPGEVKKKLPTCRPRISEEFPKSFRAKMHTSYIPFQQKCQELFQISFPSLIWLLNKASGAWSYTNTAICHSWWTKGLSQQWGRVQHFKRFPCKPWKASTTILTTEEKPKRSEIRLRLTASIPSIHSIHLWFPIIPNLACIWTIWAQMSTKARPQKMASLPWFRIGKRVPVCKKSLPRF